MPKATRSSLRTTLSGALLPVARICRPIKECNLDEPRRFVCPAMNHPIVNAVWAANFSRGKNFRTGSSLAVLADNLHPASRLMRLDDRVGHHLSCQAVVKARRGLPLGHDGRNKLPHQIIAKHRGWLPMARVARTVGRLQIL